MPTARNRARHIGLLPRYKRVAVGSPLRTSTHALGARTGPSIAQSAKLSLALQIKPRGHYKRHARFRTLTLRRQAARARSSAVTIDCLRLGQWRRTVVTVGLPT